MEREASKQAEHDMNAAQQLQSDMKNFTHLQEEGLHETGALIDDEDSRAEVKLRTTLEELASSAMKYVAITKNSLTGPGTGKTKLDKERMKLCEREIVNEMTFT